MSHSILLPTVVKRSTTALAVAAALLLVAAHADVTAAQDEPLAAPVATPVATPVVSDNTRNATAAAMQNSLLNAWQTLVQGQALNYQLQQQTATNLYRARYGY